MSKGWSYRPSRNPRLSRLRKPLLPLPQRNSFRPAPHPRGYSARGMNIASTTVNYSYHNSYLTFNMDSGTRVSYWGSYPRG